MRVKEGAADYRYFQNQTYPLEISDEWIEEMDWAARVSKERRARYVSDSFVRLRC